MENFEKDDEYHDKMLEVRNLIFAALKIHEDAFHEGRGCREERINIVTYIAACVDLQQEDIDEIQANYALHSTIYAANGESRPDDEWPSEIKSH